MTPDPADADETAPCLSDVRALTASEAVALGERLVDSWGSWSPTMTRDASRMAFVSDRAGVPALWIQDIEPGGEIAAAKRIPLTEDPVIHVEWSADDQWLACAVATDGGVRTQVWVVRPDGTDARRIAGSRTEHAELGPWTRSGHRVVVTFPAAVIGGATRSFLADPATGALEPLATGGLIHVLDLSTDDRLVVLRDGQRGREFCVVVDREEDVDHPLLHDAPTGSTSIAFVRPSPTGIGVLTAYLATNAGLPRHQLLAVPLAKGGWRGTPRVMAERDDAELECLDADDAGRLLLLVWNAAGRSELELMNPQTSRRRPVPDLPGTIVSTPVLSRDGSSVTLAVEDSTHPREIWHLDTRTLEWTMLTNSPEAPEHALVVPTLERFAARDGLELSGWLYRPHHPAPGAPAIVSLHGGPEAQDRPSFNPQHQAIAAAGITVFAPNIRGSSGFGREFVHADDLEGRFAAFADVLRAAEHLVESGVAAADNIAVSGRSYGGYLALASLAFSPGVFRAGIDICGMSHMLTFYRDTEPWIAAAAVTKYGHPNRDQRLLRRISPLTQVERIDVPLLVVHGEHDTNVPIGESRQLVLALVELGRPVEYLEFGGEGHEFRHASSKKRLLATMIDFLGANLEGVSSG